MAAPRARWRAVLAAALIAAAAVVGGGAAAGGQDGVDEGIPDERPSTHVEQLLTLDVGEGAEPVAVSVRVRYPARTAAEAEAAQSQTLDPAWFQPRATVQALVDRVGDEDDELQGSVTTIGHSDTSFGHKPIEPPHGWITIQYDTVWHGFVDEGEDIRIGDGFVEVLGEDWLIEVQYPGDWEPDRLSGAPDASQVGARGISQTWNLSDNPEPPLIVFERSSEQDDDSSPIPLGPAGGIGPGALALLLVVIGATAVRRRGSNREQ